MLSLENKFSCKLFGGTLNRRQYVQSFGTFCPMVLRAIPGILCYVAHMSLVHLDQCRGTVGVF